MHILNIFILVIYARNFANCESVDYDLPDMYSNRSSYLNESQLIATSDFNDIYNKIYKFLVSAQYGDECLLDNLKQNIMWWSFPNGSLATNRFQIARNRRVLDLSYRSDNDASLRAQALKEVANRELVEFVSLAGNNLSAVPFETLELFQSSIKFLTMKGNTFTRKGCTATNTCGNRTKYWATFPHLPAIKQLDISNCQIDTIRRDMFANLTSLEHLFMSHNKMSEIGSDAFVHLKNLQYLDLSFTISINLDYIPYPTVEAYFHSLLNGVKIYQNTFKNLEKLEFLDLSHTKLTRSSALAFTNFRPSMQYISLCYTAFPLIGTRMFQNSRLRAIDLSGNPNAAYNILPDTFKAVARTLRYVFFERSDLKSIEWVIPLKRLIAIGARANNINTLPVGTFDKAKNLEIVDFSSNHIGNWYSRVFSHNANLKLLNIRDNNINIITSEMLLDFQGLEYLGIGDNNFVCDCVLKDLLDIAAANNNESECTPVANSNEIILEYWHKLSNWSKNHSILEIIKQNDRTVYSFLMGRYRKSVDSSYERMKIAKRKFGGKFNYKLISQFYQRTFKTQNDCTSKENIFIYNKINGSSLNFQLLDYDDQNYWCFNETKKLALSEMDCMFRSYVPVNVEAVIRKWTRIAISICASFLLVLIFSVLAYWKRWHIRYYYISLKTSAMMMAMAKKKERTTLDIDSDGNVYDIFISYSDGDREWVLEELMPNIDMPDEMSICLHERDFQVGLTILENIISCMDRSRCLLMVVSKSFLLSHWCQFEMHLAQHRMFEANKEHLILILLEDIPKGLRPKNLQYLMDVKTYIKWPTSDDTIEEKKLFWKRLRHALVNIGWDRQFTSTV